MKVFLVAWDETNAQRLAAELAAQGWETAVESEDGRRAYNAIKDMAPDAVVFDMARKPSHSKAVAKSLLNTARTRGMPMVFVDTPADHSRTVDATFPAAAFVTRDELVTHLRGLYQT